MSELEKRRKWLSWKTLVKCLFISAGVLIIALIYEVAKGAVTSNLPMVEKSAYVFFMWLLLGGFLLIYGLLSPELMEAVFKMLGYKEEEEEK